MFKSTQADFDTSMHQDVKESQNAAVTQTVIAGPDADAMRAEKRLVRKLGD